MSVPSISRVFETELAGQRMSYLDRMIRNKLEHVVQDIVMDLDEPSRPISSEPTAMVNELGDYYTRTALVWSSLADDLFKSPEIQDIIMRAGMEAHNIAKNQHNMSNLATISSLDVNISRLRKMRNLSQTFYRDMRSIWRPDPDNGNSASLLPITQPAFIDPRPIPSPQRVSLASDGDLSALSARKTLPDTSHVGALSPVADGSGSEESTDDDEQFSRIDMAALKQRGKGAYYCPKGHRCDKGGVDKSGSLVQFDRNSSFVQHCNKHRKPWRCELPGCPNPPKKRKFARRDGLERHKHTVKHHAVT